jgi:lysyl-tRNA synthetase, class II
MSVDSSSENPLRAEKRRKLHELKKAGINPYPYSFDRNAHTFEIVQRHSNLVSGEKLPETHYRIAGRLMTKRDMGKASFFNVQDQSGGIQG